MISNVFSKNLFFYEMIWKNIAGLERPQMTIWRMRISRWVPKATVIHFRNR